MSPTFEISIPHVYCLEYREAGRKLLLEIDFRDPVIYLDDALPIEWEDPHESEAIEPAEQKRILGNIYNYLVKERGFRCVSPASLEEFDRRTL